MVGTSTTVKGCLVAVIAERALHNWYLSLPWKSATVRPCVPKTAHDQIEQLRPAVILLDCGLEVDKGLRMLRELKESHTHIPVIFLTDSKTYDTVLGAYHAGARDFVGKPANIFELRNVVEGILKVKQDCNEVRAPFTRARSSDAEPLEGMNFGKPVSILRAIRYVEDNLSNPITLDLLAREAGLSKYHFSRVFYRHTRMTPIQFAARMRVEKAKGLLKVGELNISGVGEQVGFSNLSSFIRQFKNCTGKTPSDYRQSDAKTA